MTDRNWQISYRGQVLGQVQEQGLPGQAVSAQRRLEGPQQQTCLPQHHNQQPQQAPPRFGVLAQHLAPDVEVEGCEE